MKRNNLYRAKKVKVCAVLLFYLFTFLPLYSQNYRQYMNLAGTWTTELGNITLPGTTDTNRKGNALEKKDETTHLSRLYSYVGELAYSREITIPESWNKKSILLHMERTKATKVFVDGKLVGNSNDISTEQVYNLTEFLKPGPHQLTIKVDNTDKTVPPQLLSNSHAYTEDTQTNWNGIIGNFFLEAVNPIYISRIDIKTHSASKAFEADILIKGTSKKDFVVSAVLAPLGSDFGTVLMENVIKKDKKSSHHLVLKYQNDSLKLWDEQHPNIYRLLVNIEGYDFQEVVFGICDFQKAGTQFTVNGHKTFLRGKHDACVFPYTGHVPMDLASWRRYLQICKGYGINHLRFHSWCPPEAAFMAADIEGVYMQPELPFWGDFKRDDNNLMTFLHKEGTNILFKYGHHPSFVMFALGNELRGDIPTMKKFTDDFRRIVPDKLYTFGSNYYLGYQGWKEGMDFFVTCRNGGETWGNFNTHTRGSFSFADAFDGGMINHSYPNSSMNFDEAVDKCPVPIISHETGQFQTYPDYNEIKKYTGVLYPYNMEIFRDRLEKAGMADQAEAFHRASGHWSVQLYKADIEMDLRTRGMAGFQLLDIQDYPGQGSAYVGILDAFMESKGITTPKEWRQWCNDVVPLAVLPKFCYTNNEQLKAKIQIANYGQESLEGKTLHCCLVSSDKEKNKNTVCGTGIVIEKSFTLTAGNGLLDVGTFDIDLSKLEFLKDPEKLTLYSFIEDTDYENSWPVWIYPAGTNPDSKGIIVCNQLTSEIQKKLANGAKVLFMPDSTINHQPLTINPQLLLGGLFQTDYWNYRMFKTISENNNKPVSPGTLGILTNPEHPVFKAFPTEEHTSWQWFPIVKNARPFILDNTPSAYRPIVQVIDNIERNHKLGLLFEFRVGKGSLLICMSPLQQLQQYPEARQFYASILSYMQSKDFTPKTNISTEELHRVLTTPVQEGQMKKLFNITTYQEGSL